MPGALGQGGGFGVGVPDGRRGQPVEHGPDRLEVRCGLPVHHEFGVVGETQKARPSRRAAGPWTLRGRGRRGCRRCFPGRWRPRRGGGGPPGSPGRPGRAGCSAGSGSAGICPRGPAARAASAALATSSAGRPARSPASSSSRAADFIPSLTRCPNSVPSRESSAFSDLSFSWPASSSWIPDWRNSLRYSSTSRADSASRPLRVDGGEALIEPAVEVDGVLVGGKAGRELGFEVADGVRGVCRNQCEEGRGSALEQPPDRSMATAVFSKVAGPALSTMAWISARCSARPASTASA